MRCRAMLSTDTLTVKALGMTSPLRLLMVSGIPDPAARGSTWAATRLVVRAARQRGRTTAGTHGSATHEDHDAAAKEDESSGKEDEVHEGEGEPTEVYGDRPTATGTDRLS